MQCNDVVMLVDKAKYDFFTTADVKVIAPITSIL